MPVGRRISKKIEEDDPAAITEEVEPAALPSTGGFRPPQL